VSDPGELSDHFNVPVGDILAIVRVRAVSDEVISVILSKRGQEKGPNDELGVIYDDIAARILNLTIRYINRIILYARNNKGQYWLETYDIDLRQMSSYFLKFKAKGKIDGEEEWFRWYPYNVDFREIRCVDEDRYITQQDWDDVKKYIASTRTPNLSLELLANAENLLGNGHRRSAVIEAVSALAVARFSRNPRIASFDPDINKRINLSNLKPQIKHLGFSATVRFLLPLLFTESVLSNQIIRECEQIVSIRQTVVHNGQRDVEESKAYSGLQAIRQLVTILDDFTV
jgi:hypothetical protein